MEFCRFVLASLHAANCCHNRKCLYSSNPYRKVPGPTCDKRRGESEVTLRATSRFNLYIARHFAFVNRVEKLLGKTGCCARFSRQVSSEGQRMPSERSSLRMSDGVPQNTNPSQHTSDRQRTFSTRRTTVVSRLPT